MRYGKIDIIDTGKFLKIDSGQPRDIRILSEVPNERIGHGFGQDFVICTQDDDCLDCQSTDPNRKLKQRFFVNVYDWKSQKVMIWEFGTMVMKILMKIDASLESEGHKITEYDLRVDAEGDKLNKKYSVTLKVNTKMLPPGLKLLQMEGQPVMMS